MDTASLLPSNTFSLLERALDAFRRLHYIQVDLPWIVEKQYSDATRPTTARDFETPYGSLVASGEQSFLQLYFEARLKPRGMSPGYVGWTPCFRDEAVDVLHRPAFIKVEWFVPDVPLNYDLLLQARMYEQVKMFRELAWHLNVPLEVAKKQIQIVPTGLHTWDIEADGVEIGSYGFRTWNDLNYLYGTGLALPRFAQAFAPWIRP